MRRPTAGPFVCFATPIAFAVAAIAAPATVPSAADAVLAAVQAGLDAAAGGDRTATLAAFDRPDLPATAQVVDRLTDAMHNGRLAAKTVTADVNGGDVAVVTLEFRQPGRPVDVEPMEVFRAADGWKITVYRTKSTATPDQQARLKDRLLAWRAAHRPASTGPSTRPAARVP